MKITRKRNGFTLMELLVVIAIIAMLSSIILASLNKARSQARDGSRVADMKQIQLALSVYYNDNGYYPPGRSLEPLVTGSYISVIPVDPASSQGYTYTYQGLTSALGACTSDCTSYVLRSVLESGGNNALESDSDGVIGGVSCVDGPNGSPWYFCSMP